MRTSTVAINQLWTALVVLILSTQASAILGAQPDTPEDVLISQYTLAIETDERSGILTVEQDGESLSREFDLTDIRALRGKLTIPPDVEFTSDGLIIGSAIFDLQNLRVEDVYEDSDDLIGITFKHREPSKSSRRRVTSRNRIAFGEELVIDHEDFVRGDVVNFGGDIEVAGEINRNVVSIFGDVRIVSEGIVRGDVVCLDGRVYLKDEAAVYGETMAHRGVKKSRGARVRFDSDAWAPEKFDVFGYYNRVDGLFLGGKLVISDADSMLPTVFGDCGYAFESERWKYELGVHQRIFDYYSFGLGGSFYRKTMTDDEWLSPGWESTALALLVAEDFRDYYEEEGGRIYLTFNPGYYNEAGVSYQYSELDWLDHHPGLWALFGSSKDFRANFSSIESAERLERRDEFNRKLGQLTAWYILDTRDDPDFPYSGWWGHLEYQTAGDDLKGDLNFDRFTAEVRRYQPITRYQQINARIKYGTSGRDLPLFRTFYLGGMRTIRGLDHKSLRGDQMALVNLEYVIGFRHVPVRTALLFDVGKVLSRDENILSDGDFHSSIGLRFGFEEGLSLEVSKSLDDSEESVKLWVTFQKSF